MYSSIFLTGFRSTGKTTLGKALAEKLGWNFFDNDAVISERTGVTIDELTKQGTDWKLFRQMEIDLLKEMLGRQNIVFSMGGGGCVNDVLHEASGKTFGDIGAEMLSQALDVLVVSLTADEKIISDRIREAEMNQSEGVVRPLLDSEQAVQMQGLEKGIQVNDIILDSLKVFRQRQPFYSRISSNSIDTGKLSVEECIGEIMKLL